jgi:diguanylate cyclase (GGDEF)-like protein
MYDNISKPVSVPTMRKPVLLTIESFPRLIPLDRLDAQGRELYVALLSCDRTRDFHRLAVTLLEHMCETGTFRRLPQTGPDERVSYRNLTSLDTITLIGEAAPPEPEPKGALPDADATRREPAPPDLSIPPPGILDRLIEAFQPADLSKSISRLRDLLKSWMRCETVSVCLTESLSNSDAGTRLELEDVCIPRESEQAAPEAIRDRVEETAETVSIPDTGADIVYARHGARTAGGSLAVAPLKSEAYVYGTLAVWCPAPHAFSAEDVRFIGHVGEFMAQLIRARLELENLIYVDPTTQIYNRRYFDEQLPREIERSKRTGNSSGLLIADIDYFKRVNDTLGHAAGDSALRHVAQILTESVRPVDIVARYGGEEFGLILPDVDNEGARTVAERVRKNVEMNGFRTGRSKPPVWDLTISVGGALYPTDARDTTELMDMADRLSLREAKRRGRNRVVLFTDL